MQTLAPDLRRQLERTVVEARDVAEAGARVALEALAVQHHEPYGHMDGEQRTLRKRLRAHARQLGDRVDARSGGHGIDHLVREYAYEHWHGMLFARFLAENHLLIEPEMGVAITLDECEELGKDEGVDKWMLAARFAHGMLPQVFRPDHPVFEVQFAREHRLKLEGLVEDLPVDVFTAADSLGWVYQFWQTKKKGEVNAAGGKIGADELPSVTQLFTEDYMVNFLLDNTLGAWHAGKVFAANPKLAENARSEGKLRQVVALPGCPWSYLRFIHCKTPSPLGGEGGGEGGAWTPVAGTFGGWPNSAKEIKCLDPCMGSGHFVVAMFERLVALRLAEEKLDETTAVASVIRDNLFGLEIDPRCTQIGVFNLALAAWRRVGHRPLPAMNLACSGLAPNTREADWLAIAGDDQKLHRGTERLYRLFQKASVLGSLINPRASKGDLLEATFHELQPLLDKALAHETQDDTAHEMAVTARGLAKAAEILTGQFTLVATNVPYLRRGNQFAELQDYVEEFFTDGRADLATAFLQRCLALLEPNGTSACVSQQHFLYLGSYEDFRISMLAKTRVKFVVRLGPGSFEAISGENVTVALSCVSRSTPIGDESLFYCDAQTAKTPTDKAELIRCGEFTELGQNAQSNNPDSRIGFSHDSSTPLLHTRSGAFVGLQNGDTPRFVLSFWELPRIAFPWDAFQLTSDETTPYGGRDGILRWEKGKGVLASAPYARVQGTEAWGRKGVAVRNTIPLPVTLYSGELYDQSSTGIIPEDPKDLPALWAFCSSYEFFPAVQLVDGKRNKTNQTYLKIPFDLAHWQKVAAEKYPDGLPKPFSSDPTQWLFSGQPQGSDQPLQVAVARLLGYQWPRQTGSSFPDCPALGPDRLEKVADDDGIVCVPAVRGERPAHERVLRMLQAAWSDDWNDGILAKLLTAAGSSNLDDWLRNGFFEQHCKLFHHRPFIWHIWHIWDGRKRDGFHALVNYHKIAGSDFGQLKAGPKGEPQGGGEHKLAEGDGNGRRLLESLTYSYL
ncbi:MAG: N-6 DNA methylase, partial [Pseudomonadota bacterium]|nr:N-6 DNA methylase [Pseudomonadota bacterium]